MFGIYVVIAKFGLSFVIVCCVRDVSPFVCCWHVYLGVYGFSYLGYAV